MTFNLEIDTKVEMKLFQKKRHFSSLKITVESLPGAKPLTEILKMLSKAAYSHKMPPFTSRTA